MIFVLAYVLSSTKNCIKIARRIEKKREQVKGNTIDRKKESQKKNKRKKYARQERTKKQKIKQQKARKKITLESKYFFFSIYGKGRLKIRKS